MTLLVCCSYNNLCISARSQHP